MSITPFDFLSTTSLSPDYRAARQAVLEYYFPGQWNADRGVNNATLNSILPPSMQISEALNFAGFRSIYNALNDPDAFILSMLLPGSTALVAAMPSPATCFTDTARTTPATVGQAVAGITDPSGYGLHPTQAVVASRPILRQAGTGEYYLEFDGVDDFLVTPTITPGADKMQVFAGVRKLTDLAGIIVESGTVGGGAIGGFGFFGPSANRPDYGFLARGTVAAPPALSFSGQPAPISSVVTGIGDISGDAELLRHNGVQIAQSFADQGTGNYSANLVHIGMRAGTSAPFNGHIYSLILRFGPNLSDAQIAATERYVAARTAGVTL